MVQDGRLALTLTLTLILTLTRTLTLTLTVTLNMAGKLSFPAPPARLPPRAGASGEASPKRGAGPPPLPGMRRGGAGDSFSKRFGIGIGIGLASAGLA